MTGAKAHAARLKRIQGEEMVREVGKALFAAGNMIEVEAEISITAGSVSGAGHIPSKPGSPPNRDTGVLDGNIETTLVEPLKVEISSNAPYSAALEFGTSKMAARPYMRPAAQKKKAEAVELVRRAVKKVVDQAGQGNPKG
ncbi:HK97-gp10 family putative phage morphogenesis protein [Caulobacter hibisci]|uniref:HK97 gp10 family phage protein n=1 Tax=Caulobacter hibisci TaxID=2035993 RepID=A0ABS0SS18_9CAUL|nr:HK97 gp10 family phage protein [Caulobacter hibisci]